jgi:hypothetical protein
MARHVLFLVHGMGKHDPATWAGEIWKKLVECSTRYAFFNGAGRDLDSLAEMIGVSYDDKLQGLLDEWAQSGKTFADFAKGHELLDPDLVNWIPGVEAVNSDFLYASVADVVLYRYFKQVHNWIQDTVKARLGEVIADRRAKDASTEFSLVAHSLGTAVAHDALCELGAEKLAGKTNTFSTKNFHFRSIHMLANTSRLLEDEHRAYTSIVRPGDQGDPKSYCLRMFNHHHELDPICMVRPFQPPGFGDLFTNEQALHHYRAWNVHGFTHYLDHPRVHIPILRSIVSSIAIPLPEAAAAIDSYETFGGDFAMVQDVKASIERIDQLANDLDRSAGLRENLATITKMFVELRELKQLITHPTIPLPDFEDA